MWRIVLVIIVLSTVFTLVKRTLPVFSASFSDIIIEDMKLPNEGKPHGVAGYSWETNSDPADSTSFPSGYGAIQGWGDLYVDINGNPATNTRVQIRNFQTWWLSKNSNTWIRAQYEEKSMGGAAFTEDYNGSKNGEIKMIDGYPTITAGGGYNFHFWHTQDGWNIPGTGDYKAIVTAFEARLVKDSPGGVDDRAQAKFLLKSAVDTYVFQGNHGSSGKLPNFGIGRSKYVTPEWRLFTHNSISTFDESVIRNNPPPIIVGADYPGGGTSPTDVNCPKKPQGDADCNGTVSLADYQIWRTEFQGTQTTKRSDFNSDGKISLVDYQTWRNTFKGSSTTPGNNACVLGQNGTVKIMPLGDSVTAGTDGRGGYRFKLYTLLKNGGVSVDFVGPNKDGTVVDNDNAGFGGYPAGRPTDSPSIAREVPGLISQYSPHAVLLNAGVNDKWGGINGQIFSDSEVANNVINVTKQLNSLAPNTLVVVSALTSWGSTDNGDPSRVAINNQIGTAINQMKAQGTPVLWIPESGTEIKGSDTAGDVHMTAAGYDKFADIWFRGIKPLLIDCKQ